MKWLVQYLKEQTKGLTVYGILIYFQNVYVFKTPDGPNLK